MFITHITIKTYLFKTEDRLDGQNINKLYKTIAMAFTIMFY